MSVFEITFYILIGASGLCFVAYVICDACCDCFALAFIGLLLKCLGLVLLAIGLVIGFIAVFKELEATENSLRCICPLCDNQTLFCPDCGAKATIDQLN